MFPWILYLVVSTTPLDSTNENFNSFCTSRVRPVTTSAWLSPLPQNGPDTDYPIHSKLCQRFEITGLPSFPLVDPTKLTATDSQDLVMNTTLASFGFAGLGLGIGAVAWWSVQDIQPFGFKETGFFQKWTDSGGGDKVGHFVSHYIGTLMMISLYEEIGLPTNDAILLGAGFAFLMGNTVELIDGFTSHQFEYGDAIMNTLGITMALLQTYFPAVKDTLGFRFGYFPSPRFTQKEEGFKPIRLVNDYSGQVVFADLKMKGVANLLGLDSRWAKYFLAGINWGSSHYRPKPGNDSLPRRNLGFHVGLSLADIVNDSSRNATIRMLGRGLSYIALPFLNLNVTKDLNQGQWYVTAGIGNRFETPLP